MSKNDSFDKPKGLSRHRALSTGDKKIKPMEKPKKQKIKMIKRSK